jgi:hypothetical protein
MIYNKREGDERMKRNYVYIFMSILLVAFLCSFTLLNGRVNHENQNLKNEGYFSLTVPSKWKVIRIGSQGMYFGKSEQNNFGGVFIEEFNVNFNAGEKKLPSNSSLLQWMLPNHTEVTKVQKLKGFFTETYLIKLISSEPAGQGGKITGKWTYIIFIDKSKSTSIKWVADEFYFNTKYVSEKEVINIAKTFRIIK